MHDRHNDVVFWDPVGGQPSHQVVEVAKSSRDRGGPLLLANSNALADVDTIASSEALEKSNKGRINWPSGGEDR
jgi:hypothetical protein